MKAIALMAHRDDNVAVTTAAVLTGESIDVGGTKVTATQDVPPYHKVAVTRIPKGGTVLRYGHSIGVASADIEVGQWVHTHNLVSGEE